MFKGKIMKHKTALLPGLILAVAVFQIYCHDTAGAKQKTKAESVAAAAPEMQKPAMSKETAATVQNRQLTVYYFHGNARCPTCFKLESYAKSEVEADFADAIRKSAVEWKTINVEDNGNEHYGEEYKLYTKSVIISIRENGKESSWKNLDQIWQLVHDETKYREYIKNEVTACLNGKCL